MTTSILSTKLYIPQRRPQLVARPRLVQALNGGMSCRLILICAPAGFGKTTLLSDWIVQNPKPVAWLSLDESDSDTTRFLAYIVAALQTLDKKIADSAHYMLHSPEASSWRAVCTALLNDISNYHEEICLVLDDYHLVDCEEVNELVNYIIDHLPPKFHLIMVTREDPSLPLARLRARCHLMELRAADLRFTADEAADFLGQVMGLTLTGQSIQTLEERTEGWIAGLQLAALSLRGQEDQEKFIRDFSGSHHFVLDYLMQEVLHGQETAIQEFLLKTSIFNRLCADLCDAVLPEVSLTGQQALEIIQSSNLFLVPLDNERKWYRYHHLFAEVLRARLAKESGSQRILHQRGSQWFEGQGLFAEAIDHALAAEDYSHAADLIEQSRQDMELNLQYQAWLEWAQRLPETVMERRPVLLMGYATALFDVGELEQGEKRIRQVEGLLRYPFEELHVLDREQFDLLPATIACARGYYSQSHNDLDASISYAKKALSFVPQENYAKQAEPLALLGLANYAKGDLGAAYEAFNSGMGMLIKSGHPQFAIGGNFVLADIRVAQGRLSQAVKIYEDCLREYDSSELAFVPGIAYQHLGLAELKRQLGDGQAAQDHLRMSFSLGEKLPFQFWRYRFCLVESQLKQDAGDWQGAMETLNRAEGLCYRHPVPEFRPVTARKMQLLLLQDKMAEVLDWSQTRRLPDEKHGYLNEFEHLVYCRLRVMQYRHTGDPAVLAGIPELLEGLLAGARSADRQGSVLQIILVQSLVSQVMDEEADALEKLHQAIVMAQPEAYVRLFVDYGKPMQVLLEQIKTGSPAIEAYVKQLLTYFSPPVPVAEPHNNLVEALSRRELEILQLVAQGLSNQEISDKLFLALSTVKGHNRVIFGKLQVQRRTEAVAKARELGLI